MGIIIKTAAGHMSIVNHHSPSEDKKMEEKEAHWENITMLNSSMPRNNMKMIIGDANIRWAGRREEEKDILGEHIFGTGVDKIKETSNTETNREFAIECLRSQKMTF